MQQASVTLTRGREARTILLQMPAGAQRELAAVVCGQPEHLCDLDVTVVEHLVQQVRRALSRSELLEEHQKRHRQRLVKGCRRVRVLGTVVSGQRFG